MSTSSAKDASRQAYYARRAQVLANAALPLLRELQVLDATMRCEGVAPFVDDNVDDHSLEDAMCVLGVVRHRAAQALLGVSPSADATPPPAEA